MIPLSPTESRLYSGTGGQRDWRLPASWKGKTAELVQFGAKPGPTREVDLSSGRLAIEMEAGRPYGLRMKN